MPPTMLVIEGQLFGRSRSLFPDLSLPVPPNGRTMPRSPCAT